MVADIIVCAEPAQELWLGIEIALVDFPSHKIEGVDCLIDFT